MSKSWQGGAWWASEVKPDDAGLSGAQRCKQLRLGGRRAEPVEICAPDPAVLCAVHSVLCTSWCVLCTLLGCVLCFVDCMQCAVCRAEVCKPDPAPSQGCIVLLHPHSVRLCFARLAIVQSFNCAVHYAGSMDRPA